MRRQVRRLVRNHRRVAEALLKQITLSSEEVDQLVMN
jgi:hypothetical protein